RAAADARGRRVRRRRPVLRDPPRSGAGALRRGDAAAARRGRELHRRGDALPRRRLRRRARVTTRARGPEPPSGSPVEPKTRKRPKPADSVRELIEAIPGVTTPPAGSVEP